MVRSLAGANRLVKTRTLDFPGSVHVTGPVKEFNAGYSVIWVWGDEARNLGSGSTLKKCLQKFEQTLQRWKRLGLVYVWESDDAGRDGRAKLAGGGCQ